MLAALQGQPALAFQKPNTPQAKPTQPVSQSGGLKQTATPKPTRTLRPAGPTDTPRPTRTLRPADPTDTPEPTNTPRPTRTPRPPDDDD
jgi:type VI secretion system secreted protein VgrG